ncbi:hypothetical protein O0L34_g8627 [Tuta absoluta]|nr:hypothetical protein O0L34_g8627 [Tuta absoluta]
MDDDLPTDFQVIVVGTGMVESIVAAACSRIGKNVLHLDSSDHYGGLWASYNFDGLQKFIKEVNSDPGKQIQVYNLVEKWYIEKDAQEEKKEGEDDPTKRVWSQAHFTSEYRKFNIDMTPKLLYSRGPLVELLISSNIARYAEFRCVTRVLTWMDGKLMPVPCSRADVFATEAVSIVEKRQLMKMLTSIVAYNEQEMNNEFKDWNDRTFKDYLAHKGLTPNLIHYVLYAIAGGNNGMKCLDGVRECKKFLMSLGRYGNTPFLWPMYGSGELPQCFCRLCAVFGGVYCLNRPIDKVESKTVDEGRTRVEIDSKGKTLACDHLVIGINECPKELLSPEPAESHDISKAVFITNSSIMASEKEPLSLLRFPPLGDNDNSVTALEVGSATGSCPKGLFVVYFIANKDKDAQTDLLPYAEKIFDMSGDHSQQSDKPKCLWSLFYNVADTSAPAHSTSDAVHVCSGPDAGLDFDRAVEQVIVTSSGYGRYSTTCSDAVHVCSGPDAGLDFDRAVEQVIVTSSGYGRYSTTCSDAVHVCSGPDAGLDFDRAVEQVIVTSSGYGRYSTTCSDAVHVCSGPDAGLDFDRAVEQVIVTSSGYGRYSTTCSDAVHVCSGPDAGLDFDRAVEQVIVTSSGYGRYSTTCSDAVHVCSGPDAGLDFDRAVEQVIVTSSGYGRYSTTCSDAVHVCSGPDAGLDFDRAVEQAAAIFKRIAPDSEFLPRAPDPEEIVFEDNVAAGPEFTSDADAAGDAQ